MNRFLLALGFAVLLAVLLSTPALAITFGEPDGDRHPNVGVMIAEFPDGSHVQWCSGSLIAPSVFLTAAHCTAALDAEGVAPDKVWVTFDAVVDSSATLIPGVYDLNPNYGHDRGDLHDVAVVLLDDPVTEIAPVQLPSAGLLDELKKAGTLKQQHFVTVGYGLLREDKTRGPQVFSETSERHMATQSFLALMPAWIQFSMNPATGNGGTCYGDSGGPHFLGDTSIVVAVTTTGDTMCRATDVDYRLDTESARSYLSQFVALP